MTLYDILGVPASASTDQIRTAYVATAKRYHPDYAPTQLRSEYEQKFHAVTKVFRVLSDPRESYDKSLSLQASSTQLSAPLSPAALNRLVSPVSSSACTALAATRPQQSSALVVPGAHTSMNRSSPQASLNLMQALGSVVDPNDPLLRTVKYGTEWTLPGRYPSSNRPRSVSPRVDHAYNAGIAAAVPCGSPMNPTTVQPPEHFSSVRSSAARHPQRISATFNNGERLPDGRLLTRRGRVEVERDLSGAVRWNSSNIQTIYQSDTFAQPDSFVPPHLHSDLNSRAHTDRGRRSSWQPFTSPNVSNAHSLPPNQLSEVKKEQ
ncbi:hypothetical protein OIV83_005826 [Microbotryomycetes sp. JL201]|nr:hypothetical protein OIV83_005826 [Microbotryomycetes sp. JL201]